VLLGVALEVAGEVQVLLPRLRVGLFLVLIAVHAHVLRPSASLLLVPLDRHALHFGLCFAKLAATHRAAEYFFRIPRRRAQIVSVLGGLASLGNLREQDLLSVLLAVGVWNCLWRDRAYEDRWGQGWTGGRVGGLVGRLVVGWLLHALCPVFAPKINWILIRTVLLRSFRCLEKQSSWQTL